MALVAEQRMFHRQRGRWSHQFHHRFLKRIFEIHRIVAMNSVLVNKLNLEREKPILSSRIKQNLIQINIMSRNKILRECSLCTCATDEARTPCSYHRPALRRSTQTAGTSPLQAEQDLSFDYRITFAR